MNIWRNIQDIPTTLGQTVVTIGVFDGMHRGHRSLLDVTKTWGEKLMLPTVVLTFDPHPLAILRPDLMPPMLATVAERAAHAHELGADYMWPMSFNADMAQLSPEEFFKTILIDVLHARVVVVGENFTFGKHAAGNVDTLHELGQRYGVEVIKQPLLSEDGEIICSTLIRQSLAAGNVAHANWALGRTFSIDGQVIRGAGRGGKELGFPTANLYFPDSVALPKDGVYAGWLTIISQAPIEGDMQRGTRYPAAISVGDNPTFGDKRRSVESYVIGKHADLYGHSIVVEFVDFIREMVTFTSIDELVSTIKQDVEEVLQRLEADTTPEH
ncbi:bifunctional riboflavin kinase/FAD synthetase [Corynebacterium sp. HS2168-gen11]|uniref:bifunctional riboflavin kinase/FAD synthetase n=1 Tax=Corynebacterium sp. HS2168-gen11 TaxID=2974027 RepID=UPI0037C0E69E